MGGQQRCRILERFRNWRHQASQKEATRDGKEKNMVEDLDCRDPHISSSTFTAIMAEDSEDAESERLGNLCVANSSSDTEDEAKVYICNNETFSLPQLLSSIWLPEI